MPRIHANVSIATACGLAALLAACASAPPATAWEAGAQATIEGAVASIDTQPWTYDGNAVVEVDTPDHGRVPVQLPARWNLCRAAPVDVAALQPGMRVAATGTVIEGGGLVVCEASTHRLVPMP